MGTLTPEEMVREHNRGRKAAYPFESDEHYELRRQAFEQGYSDQFQQHGQN
jgi:hypothetical protein